MQCSKQAAFDTEERTTAGVSSGEVSPDEIEMTSKRSDIVLYKTLATIRMKIYDVITLCNLF
jgi:hypothetical protein